MYMQSRLASVHYTSEAVVINLMTKSQMIVIPISNITLLNVPTFFFIIYCFIICRTKQPDQSEGEYHVTFTNTKEERNQIVILSYFFN
jgi:hypothetical protein